MRRCLGYLLNGERRDREAHVSSLKSSGHELKDAGRLQRMFAVLTLALAQFIASPLANATFLAAPNGVIPGSLVSAQLEEPLVATTSTSREEDEAVRRAIKEHGNRKSVDDLSALEIFLSRYPSSGWRMSLLANLGLSYCSSGAFQRNLTTSSWHKAGGKSISAFA